ncbi:MAG: DUF6345 domain-containing protein [Thermoleophilia bacterium]
MRARTIGILLWVAIALMFLGQATHPAPLRAGAGDDTTKEVGTWAIKSYRTIDPSGGTDLPGALQAAGAFGQGFKDWSDFKTWDQRENANCKERHLRDPAFVLNGQAGNDQYSFDKSDIGLFVGHGDGPTFSGERRTWPHLVFDTNVDSIELLSSRVRWGNYDLEWVYIMSCYFMANGGQSDYYEASKKMMAGAHSIHGATTPYYLHYNGLQGDIALMLLGRWDGTPHTWRYSWNWMGDLYNTEGYKLRSYFGSQCENEYVPGFGYYRTTDPLPYNGTFTMYEDNHVCKRPL